MYTKAPRGLLSGLGDRLPVLKDFVLSCGLLFMTLWWQSGAHLYPPSLCWDSICWICICATHVGYSFKARVADFLGPHVRNNVKPSVKLALLGWTEGRMRPSSFEAPPCVSMWMASTSPDSGIQPQVYPICQSLH